MWFIALKLKLPSYIKWFEPFPSETVFVWTAPPPAWNQTDQGAPNIQTAVVKVLNGSTNYQLRWNYTLLDGQSILTVDLAIFDGTGQLDKIAVVVGGSATIFDRNDYRTRFSVESTSEFSTLIISKVTEKENATFQCSISLTVGTSWAYNARIFITGKWCSLLIYMRCKFTFEPHLNLTPPDLYWNLDITNGLAEYVGELTNWGKVFMCLSSY